nr:phospho-sugar mutase [Rothia santali]
MAELSALIDEAMRWVEADPDPDTQRELLDIISRAESHEGSALSLQDRFSGFLTFGTAGLRAELGAGPMRMNRVVVAKAAHGIAAYLSERAAAEHWGTPRAVVGFDARTKSHLFARDTAGILTAAGVDTFLMPLPLPTPLLAWATRLLKADAGVMVTASHNPAGDNGYKVYLGGHAADEAGRGAQLVPPADREIAEKIAQAPDVGSIPRAESGWTVLPERIAHDYEHEVCDLLPGFPPSSRRLSVVLSPLHGVGGEVMSMVLARSGFDKLRVVPEQAIPDPKFPTVEYPNPEEPGALDLAMELARGCGADLVIANDPDADRAGFAIPSPEAEGGWRMLRGDEVGALLGQVALTRMRRDSAARSVFAASIVSSRLLGRMAEEHGVGYRETLTGFKWIARVPGLTYGYEEALGYCVAPDLVRDKDGISAALLLADYADRLKEEDRTLQDVLDEIALRHGVYATDQLSLRVAELPRIGAMMRRLRETTPASLAGSAVVSVEDLAEGTSDLPPTDGMRYLTADDSRVVVRPSGTEPKLKCYLEAVVEVPEDGDRPDALARARAAAATRLRHLRTDIAAALGADS